MRVALAIVAAALVGSVPFTIAACDADDSNAPPRKGAPVDSGAVSDVDSSETSTDAATD